MTPKPIVEMGTLSGMMGKEVRTHGVLCQRKVGDVIKSHFEVSDYKDGKETITKVKLPDEKFKA